MTHQMVPYKAQMEKIHVQLNSLLQSKLAALPKDFNQTRFMQNTMAALAMIKPEKLTQLAPATITRTILKGAILGLDFLNKECYAIPYGNELNFQTDYKGERKLVKKYSIKPVIDFYSKVVREGDVFEVGIDHGKQYITFNPKPFSDKEIIGAFAVVNYKDGSMDYEEMSKKAIEHVRDSYSKKDQKGNFSKMWRESFDEACRKTVSRRLAKQIDKEFESSDQQEEFDKAGDVEFDEFEEMPVTMPERIEPEKTAEAVPADPKAEKVNEALQTAEQFADEWIKPANFYDELGMLKEAFGKKPDAMAKKGLQNWVVFLKFFGVSEKPNALESPPALLKKMSDFVNGAV